MKTIFTSSSHCSAFRCQAFTAIDLLLKNKYVTGGNDCHLFHLKFIKKSSFFSPLEMQISSFCAKRDFSCVSVTPELLRCVWVLIRRVEANFAPAVKKKKKKKRTKGI